LSFLHNYFDNPIKLFSDLYLCKFLYIFYTSANHSVSHLYLDMNISKTHTSFQNTFVRKYFHISAQSLLHEDRKIKGFSFKPYTLRHV